MISLKHILSGILLSGLITACAGNGEVTLAEGGIGGTGIAVGPITGFGSVWVNGVRYDVSGADFIRDGVRVAGQGSYRVGEIVTVSGTINGDALSGKADKVVFNNTLKGVITAINPASSTLQVLGQQVRAGSLAVLHDFSLLSDLQPGNVVEVSGNIDSQGVINATSITLIQSGVVPADVEQELKGRISALNTATQQFSLNSIRVDYSLAVLELEGNPLVNGQLVEVKSRQALQNQLLIASKIEAEDETEFSAGLEVDLEGRITAFRSSTDFVVNGVEVITMANTEFEYGVAADLQLDSSVEVEGIINQAGVLVAEEVSLRQSAANGAQEVELEGPLQALDAARQELQLLGNTVLVDAQSILLDETGDNDQSIRFSDLRVGDHLDVSGKVLTDGRILALKVERENPESERELKGVCQSVDRAAGKLVIQGVSVLTDQSTEFEQDDRELSQQQFFSLLIAGQSIVEVQGIPLGDNWIQATRIELK